MQAVPRQSAGKPAFPFYAVVWFVLATLILVTFSRIGLLGWQWHRLDNTEQALQVLLNGVRMDVVVICYVLFPLVLAWLLLPLRWLASVRFERAQRVWLVMWFGFLAFAELATPSFVNFFDHRPGRIFFEYLDRPVEVAGLIAGAYRIEATVILVVAVSLCVGCWQFLSRAPRADWSPSRRVLLGVPLLLVILMGARSSLGHRPVNPSAVAVSSDQLVNELSLSSGYKLLYAVYSLKHESAPSEIYPAMATADVFEIVQHTGPRPPRDYLAPESTHHRFGTMGEGSHPNIIIVVEESLGARFSQKLGGQPLTPELDSLANEGIWFTKLYATGTRSARGLEAIVSGFPPSPARSVLKLGLSQNNFYTIANSLKAYGYKNYFLYGGESGFDNMRGFFMNNGFDETVDVEDFETFEFKGSWGVSDGDLFTRANDIFGQQSAPFFALIFSSSFHTPYEFPPGKIALVEQPANTKNNAVKYADYALGTFIRQAKQSSWWQDTIVLIVADHDERVGGATLLPVDNFRIPGLILGAGIKPLIYDRVASQIDLVPTLLSLAGITGIAPFVGNNLFALPADYPGRAVMQYGDNHGFMVGDQVVIHRPHLPASQFRFVNQVLSPVPLDPVLASQALAMAHLPGLVYGGRRYTPLLPISKGSNDSLTIGL